MVLIHLDEWLRECNPYVRDIVQLMTLPAEQVNDSSFVINPDARPQDEHERRYNRPQGHGLQEIQVLIADEYAQREFQIRLRGGGVKSVEDTHRSFSPLHFPLIFLQGENGWDCSLKFPGAQPGTWGKNISPIMFYRFMMHYRANKSNHLLYGGKLFQVARC